ncbi:M56 family metallopeptidase [Synechocystis sp. FACHB-383]|uniref:M56 family metallopeptidase n=1 Tax=Synechocystis sp. FACHB-383 TaxID=2692864 RepID=UPI00168423B1|nr:M56 family metallopeptidase [Synechocystis sp. FACHB-383]MBD2654153.1 M56 family metallopeptidase [Synechocystis sp. FACHB-383]
MHSILFLMAVLIAFGLRWAIRYWPGKLDWPAALIFFALPPMLLISTSAAIAWMGCGWMFGLPVSMGSHLLAWIFLVWTGLSVLYLAGQTWQTLGAVQKYPISHWQGQKIRLLETDFPYSAQVGLWSPELVVSRGLLRLLTPEQIEAVLAHESAHLFYRDTWTFFCLGALRRLTFWLPETESLWQELLWQRECRADRHGANHCDPLVLAEALALVAQNAMVANPLPLGVPFAGQQDRLLARIDQLLSSPVAPSSHRFIAWGGSLLLLAIAVLPLILIPLHIK